MKSKILLISLFIFGNLLPSIGLACRATSMDYSTNEGAWIEAYRGDGSASCPIVNGLYYSKLNGPLVSLGGQMISSPIVIQDLGTNSVRFFALGLDHALWSRTLYAGWVSLGGSWIVLPSTANAMNYTEGAGFDVKYFNGDFQIAVIGTDHSLNFRKFSSGTYTNLSGYSSSAPTINLFRDVNGYTAMNFFVLGGDGGSYLRSLSASWYRVNTYFCPNVIDSDGYPLVYVAQNGSQVQEYFYQYNFWTTIAVNYSDFLNYHANGYAVQIPNSMISGAATGNLSYFPTGNSTCSKWGL